MNLGLSDFDGKRIAILLNHDRPQRILRGTASYAHDEVLGNVLTIQIDSENSDGNPELVIDEDRWSGNLTTDKDHGCEFLLELRGTDGGIEG